MEMKKIIQGLILRILGLFVLMVRVTEVLQVTVLISIIAIDLLLYLLRSTDQISLLLDRQQQLNEKKLDLKSLLDAVRASENPANDGGPTMSDDWSGTFEWDSKADDARLNIFGISKYRKNQREVSYSYPYRTFAGGSLIPF